MIKVFTKSLVIGNGNETNGFQYVADQVAKYLKENQLTSDNVTWLQSSGSSRVTITAIVG